MKTLRLLFLLFPISLSAQNWMLVAPGETYHYRRANADFITHTIKVDSVEHIGANTIYYLNRVLVKDTVSPSEIKYYANQGQFLHQKLTDNGSGRIVLESESYNYLATLALYPYAGAGYSWLADDDHNISASISSVTMGTVLGQPDSLKNIQFSDGTEWVISKNHGLISCPDVRGSGSVHLSGLASQQLGDRLYQFDDFFDFEVGTLLEYFEQFTGKFGYSSLISKNLILEKSLVADTAAYRVQRKWLRNQYDLPTGSSVTFGVDTVWLRYIQSQLQYPFPYNDQFLSNDPCNCRGTYAAVSKAGIDIGINQPPFPVSAPCSFLVRDDISFSDEMSCSTDRYYFEQFRLGLGQTEYYNSGIDFTEYKKLKGAVVQGDTIWGNISPDWVFTNTSAPAGYYNSINLFPNPAADYVYIEMQDSNEPSADVQIFSADNKLVRSLKSVDLVNAGKITLSGLPSGLYFVQVKSKNRIWRGKFYKN